MVASMVGPIVTKFCCELLVYVALMEFVPANELTAAVVHTPLLVGESGGPEPPTRASFPIVPVVTGTLLTGVTLMACAPFDEVMVGTWLAASSPPCRPPAAPNTVAAVPKTEAVNRPAALLPISSRPASARPRQSGDSHWRCRRYFTDWLVAVERPADRLRLHCLARTLPPSSDPDGLNRMPLEAAVLARFRLAISSPTRAVGAWLSAKVL
jgi:hypothetical protein